MSDNTNITPRLGAIVRYTLSEGDAIQVKSERIAAGQATRRGNDVREGDVYPAMIVRDWNSRSFAGLALHLGVKHGLYDGSSDPKLIDPEGFDDWWEILVKTPGGTGNYVRDLEQVIAESEPEEDSHWDTARRLARALNEQVGQVSVNLQVFLDGTDTLWVTSRSRFDPSTHGAFDKDAPELALPTFHFERRITEGTEDELADAVRDARREYEAKIQALEAEHYAKWWRADPRGHWTDEPVAW